MILKELLYNVSFDQLVGSIDISINGIAFDSRKINYGFIYIAQRGVNIDGHQFITSAIEKGAIAIVCHQLPTVLKEQITYIVCKDTSYALGVIAANFYDNPTRRLKVIGVTGTNGKTTTTTLLYQLATSLGFKTGLISTVNYRIAEQEFDSSHTTPDAITLQSYFAKMLEANCTYCFMEVSSHALVQHRVAGVYFVGAVFSNITHDHLDYHITFNNYIQAKKMLFDGLSKNSFAIVNKDEKQCYEMVANCNAKVKTFALHHAADYKFRIQENTFEGLSLLINGHEFHSQLIGDFNAYNLTSVYAVACELGWESEQVLVHMSMLQSAVGRFDYIKNNNGTIAVVDYAHTPDALQKVLITLNQIRTRNEQLITVVGCGGNRDTTKRPLMAQIAVKHSDKVILTSDNPRNENPRSIIADMELGIDLAMKRKTLVIEDRKEAIRTACALANEKDIILIAGKGHETYQEVNGIKHPFNDKHIVHETWNQ